MPSISTPKNNPTSTLVDLERLANQAGANDKIRGKETGIINKDTVLYSSSKGQGTHRVDKREAKQQRATDFINQTLANTVAQMPQSMQHGLTLAFMNIMNQHMPQAGQDLTGAGLQQIVTLAKQAIRNPGQQLNVTSNYDESTVRGNGPNALLKNTTLNKNLSMDKHNQSVFRLKNAVTINITDTNGIVTPVSTRGVPNPNYTQRQFTQDLFQNVNNALGRPNHPIDEKVQSYSKFNSTDDHLGPFTNGIRSDGINRDNQDVMLLKFVTKEVALAGIMPVGIGLTNYCESNNLGNAYIIPMRDQMEEVNITLLPNGDFTTQSTIRLPIQNANRQDLGSMLLTMNCNVDSQTGDYSYSVNLSDLQFNQLATDIDAGHITAAFSNALPKSH